MMWVDKCNEAPEFPQNPTDWRRFFFRLPTILPQNPNSVFTPEEMEFIRWSVIIALIILQEEGLI